MKPNKEVVYKAFNQLCQIHGQDIEKMIADNPHYRSGTLYSLGVQDMLFSIYKSYAEGNTDIAYIKCYQAFDKTLQTLNVNITNISKTIELFEWVRAFLIDYQPWFKENQQAFKNYIFQNPLLKDEERTDEQFEKVDQLTLDDCKHHILENTLLRTYVLKTGTEPFNPSTNYTINNTIVIANTMDAILGGLKTPTDDLLHFTMCFKIEDIIDYSYFVITIQYKDWIYIATDYIQFSNPRTATSSRNPGRRREQWWDTLLLPYGIIDDIIKWRSESTDLTKSYSQCLELYTQPLMEYLPFLNRVYFWMYLDCITQQIQTNHQLIKQIFTLGQLIEQKQLTGGDIVTVTDDSDKNVFSNIHYDECKQYIDNLIIPGTEKVTDLVVHSTDIIQQHSQYNPGLLVTDTDYHRLQKWYVKDSIYKDKQSRLNAYAKQYLQSDKELLKKRLYDRIPELLNIATLGNEVYYYDIDSQPVTNFSTGPKINISILKLRKRTGWAEIMLYQNYTDKYAYTNAYCPICGKFKTHDESGVMFVIEHYEQLCMLLGCTRTELPGYFQNYMSYRNIPYYGNQILDNVNPEFLLTDPCSQQHQNGIRIVVRCCARCLKTYLQSNYEFDKSLVLWSSSTKQYVDVVDYESWKEENKHLQTESVMYI